jgi:hypothetical protein
MFHQLLYNGKLVGLNSSASVWQQPTRAFGSLNFADGVGRGFKP